MPQDAHKKAVLTATPDSVGSPEIHFNEKLFADAISDKGYDCLIERGLRCPCQQQTTGGGLSDCLNCGGTGWFFVDKQKTRLHAMSMSNRSKYKEWTAENAGTISISARPEDKLGFMDRLTFTELERWHSQIIRFNKNIALDKVFAFAQYFPIKIFQLYYFNGSNQPLVRIPDSDILIVDNQIQLAPYSTYSGLTELTCTVRFTHNPQYFVLDINRDLIKLPVNKVPCDTGIPAKQNLPINGVGRMVHYVLDAPKFDGVGLFDNTDYTQIQNYNR